MMTNMLSTFDPSTGIMSTNWISMSIIMFMMPFKYWIMPNKMSMMMNKTFNKIHQENKMMSNKGTTLIMISTMMTIMFNNTMGLMPYVFTSSAHLVFSLSLALPKWMSYMIYGWVKKKKNIQTPCTNSYTYNTNTIHNHHRNNQKHNPTWIISSTINSKHNRSTPTNIPLSK